MSVDSLVFWLFVVAWAIVGGLILFVQIPRVIGEARRIIRRLIDLVDKSPLPLQLAKAEADLVRIDRALERFPALAIRANAAVQVVRQTPIVPPAAIAAIRRISSELTEFRRELR